ncbi:MAG: fructose-bisphosphatase class II, partial [Solirubrobacterales bacterium]
LMILDRPRHEETVAEVRAAGASVRFITDGDVQAALLAVSEDTGVDLLWGIGGTPEGVLAASAIKCLGGELIGRLWPRDEGELSPYVAGGPGNQDPISRTFHRSPP